MKTEMNSTPVFVKTDGGGNGTIPVRQCGRYELQLPILGMGCWAYGGGEYWGAQSQKDVNDVVHCAVDLGCNFFDTAEAYNDGASEGSLGIALQGISRDRILVGTKISPSNTRTDTLKEHCEASLKRLRTDYVDIYMVHWPITPHSIKHFTKENIPTPNVQDAFDTLVQLKKAGKIRYIGVSNFGPAKLAEAMATGAEIAINELPYSLLTRAIELEILPKCRALGVAAKVKQIKQWLEQNPNGKIPELQYLTAQEWLRGANYTAELKTDDDFDRALSQLRRDAKRTFAYSMGEALANYIAGNSGQLPSDISQLESYFNPPIDGTMLQRYQLLQTGNLSDFPNNEPLIAEKAPVDDQYDSLFKISATGFSYQGTGTPWVNGSGKGDFGTNITAKMKPFERP